MKITFLGTGSGEGYPAAWCECPHCTYARTHGGKNVRTYSSAVLDDALLLDMGPSTFYAAARFGVNLARVHTLLVTHPHEDHFFPLMIRCRGAAGDPVGKPYFEQLRYTGACMTKPPRFTIYGNHYVRESIESYLNIIDHPTIRSTEGGKTLGDFADYLEENGVSYAPVAENAPFDVQGYRITPVRGMHITPDYAMSYIVEKDGKTLLYALDTSGFEADMMQVILAHRYDLVVMEGTYGVNQKTEGHMGLEANVRLLAALREKGCMKPGARCLLSHMSPHWCPPHDWYEAYTMPHGIELAYDGLTIEF